MFLITTADQRFWKTDDPIIFLGEWCKLFSQKFVWEKFSSDILPYHWDDRKKLYHDYLYLDKLYEQTLLDMRDLLNKIHGVDYSLRYWRIIVGPWLYYFIQILFDRYQSILAAIKSGKVNNTLICKYDDAKWVPRDFPCFLNWYVDDAYNHYIYSRIIEFTGRMPFEVVNIEDGCDSKRYASNPFAPKQILKKLMMFCMKLVPDRLNQIVLISSYLNMLDLIKLQLSLQQFPYLFPPDVETPKSTINMDKRETLSLKSSKNEFEKLLGKMIMEQIPLVYVEGYTEMNEHSLRAYPKKPKVLFTANACLSNESFKFWAGHHVDRGAKLVGTQHGGHYGTGLWSSTEKHEIQIYNMFYTWGWKSETYKNTKPLAAVKLNMAKRVVPKNDGRILLVLMAVPRYSYHMYSLPVSSSGMLLYINDQYRFVRKLSKENQKPLLVYPYHQDYKWSQMERWNSEFPEIECSRNGKSILDQLNESRLFIGTYNATTYIETFVANFPTIMFWNPDHWELNPSAQPYFDELRKVGILHDTPESAAAMVNEISLDPAFWWNQPKVQRAKNQFCFKFARTSDNWLYEWNETLNSL